MSRSTHPFKHLHISKRLIQNAQLIYPRLKALTPKSGYSLLACQGEGGKTQATRGLRLGKTFRRSLKPHRHLHILPWMPRFAQRQRINPKSLATRLYLSNMYGRRVNQSAWTISPLQAVGKVLLGLLRRQVLLAPSFKMLES